MNSFKDIFLIVIMWSTVSMQGFIFGMNKDVAATMALSYIAASYKKIAENVAAGGIGLAGLTFGLWLDKKIEHIIDESIKKDIELREWVNQQLNNAKILGVDKVSQVIDGRISELLRQEYMPKYEFFCTSKSKILVLQNIQDFFEFKQDKKYAVFNALVYEICIKKINELEQQETSQTDEWIDKARDKYIRQYGVSIEQLNNMAFAMLSEKINVITTEIDTLFEKITTVTVEMDIVGNDLDEDALQDNIEFLALVSILGHLEYKKKYKIKENYKGYSLDPFFEEGEYGKHLEVMKKALAAKKIVQQKWLTERNREQQAYVIAPEENKKILEKKYGLTLQKQSIFSRMRSWWNSWWYGNK